jgi:hypothetical protein
MFTDDSDLIDEMFPAMPAVDMAAQQVQQAGAQASKEMGGGGAPNMQGGQGQKADQNREAPGADQQMSPGAPTPDQAGMQ